MSETDQSGDTSPQAGAPLHRLSRYVFGLQTKFTVLVVGLAIAVGLLAGTVTMDLNSNVINRVHLDHCRQTAAILADRAVPEYAVGENALQKLAEHVVVTDPFTFVAFMDPAGVTLTIASADSYKDLEDSVRGFTPHTTIGTPALVPKRRDRAAYLDVTYPVQATHTVEDDDAEQKSDHVRSELLGYVRIGFSLERTVREVSATMDLLSGVAVLLVTLTIPVGFVLVRRVVGPLHSLANVMSRFADGDSSARSPIRRTDEIGELSDGYNAMAEKLTQKHQEIVQLNSDLEDRVEERTRQLLELASRDPLTGLYNRRHFAEVVQRRMSEARRYGTELACVMIDVDDFKAVNDLFGHQTGDEVLILTAITINSQLRSADLAARFGGDEFIILLPQTDASRARFLAERIQKELSKNLAEQFPQLSSHVSIGIGCMTDVATEDPEELIRAADKALYDAKLDGKNTIATRRVSV